MPDDLAKDFLLADPPGDQLAVLRAEVEDEDALGVGVRHGCGGPAVVGAVADERRGAHCRAGVASVVVDCESGPVRLGLARALGAWLGGEVVRLDELAADSLAGVVRSARNPRSAA